jgi:hypothetical protein
MKRRGTYKRVSLEHTRQDDNQLQYEHISHYPLLFNGWQQNVTVILGVGFMPENKKHQQ